MLNRFTLTNMLLMFVLLGLIFIGQSVAHMEEKFEATRLEARTASTFVLYWFPPLSGSKISCLRCHR